MRRGRTLICVAVLAVTLDAGGCSMNEYDARQRDAGSRTDHTPARINDAAAEVTEADATVPDRADVSEPSPADASPEPSDAAEGSAEVSDPADALDDPADESACEADAHATEAGCLTCQEARTLEAEQAWAWMLDHRDCTTDDECAITSSVNHCWHACLLTLRKDALADFATLLHQLDLAYCGDCDKDGHLCLFASPVRAKCSAGKCTWGR